MKPQDVFKRDLFAIRRTNQTGAGNPYDPESLISGKEAWEGMTYENSHREWPNEKDYTRAMEGKMITDEILSKHPRVLNDRDHDNQTVIGYDVN